MLYIKCLSSPLGMKTILSLFVNPKTLWATCTSLHQRNKMINWHRNWAKNCRNHTSYVATFTLFLKILNLRYDANRDIYGSGEQEVEHWIVGDERQILSRLFVRPACSVSTREIITNYPKKIKQKEHHQWCRNNAKNALSCRLESLLYLQKNGEFSNPKVESINRIAGTNINYRFQKVKAPKVKVLFML